MFLDDQRWLEAEQDFDQLLATAPNFRDAEALRGRARERQAEISRAAFGGSSAEDTMQRAQEAMSAGEWTMASGLLEQVAEARPDDDALSEKLEAVRVMARVTELNAAAARLVEQGRWAEAMEKMEEAKQLDPHYRTG